mgnify:FL=1
MNSYITHLPIPEGTSARAVREAERLRAEFRTDATVRDGALRWNSNGRPVPLDVLRDAFCEAPQEHHTAYSENIGALLAEYRRRDPRLDGEALAEARSVHGAGATVVNVITGRRTRL